jgi:hypothetical protein
MNSHKYFRIVIRTWLLVIRDKNQIPFIPVKTSKSTIKFSDHLIKAEMFL